MEISNFGLYGFVFARDPLSSVTLCAPREKQSKGNLGQQRLDDVKVEFGATKNHV